ncbi:signal recognition particle subunit SRP72-like [Styela clava]
MAEVNILSSMFTELNKAIHVSDYKQALKITNKIIHTKEGNHDEKAMHCKVACMINLNQFSEALKFLQSEPSIDKTLIFEKAYCQYRLLQTDKALDTINEVKDLDNRLMELKAQVLYKLGFYNDSLDLYKRLMKECADEDEEERKANLLAVTASLSLWQNKQVNVDLELSSHEQFYNKSCQLLGAGKAKEAEELLDRAITECKEYFEEDPDVTDEDIESELAVLKVQRAYAMQLQGREDEAMKVYNQVLKSRPSDIGIVAVASNNIITINREQNVFDSKKKLKATFVSGIEQKLVGKQLSSIEINKSLLYMYSNQWEACRKLLKNLKRSHKDSDVPCLIQAAQFCREKNFDKAIAFLFDFIENHSDPDVHSIDLTNVKLTLVQLLLGQNQTDRACEILEEMESICYRPGVISLLVALYDRQKGSESKVIKILNQAINWHQKKKSSNKIVSKLMWECAQYKLKRHRPKEAAETLEKMRKIDPNNVKVLAQLIFAYSQFNPSKAHHLSEDLPSLEEMSLSVDVDHLEKNAIGLLAPRYVKRQAKQQQKLQQTKTGKNMASGDEGGKKKKSKAKETVSEVKTDEVVNAEKKKRKRKKKRLPQNYDPAIEPDPERWIPLRERSYYKGRRKDRKKGVGTGTQGSSTISADSLDMSKQSTTQTAGSTTPASPKPGTAAVNSPKPSSGARPKTKQTARNRKKKGKGGGW